jgi:hypothetical protein
VFDNEMYDRIFYMVNPNNSVVPPSAKSPYATPHEISILATAAVQSIEYNASGRVNVINSDPCIRRIDDLSLDSQMSEVLGEWERCSVTSLRAHGNQGVIYEFEQALGTKESLGRLVMLTQRGSGLDAQSILQAGVMRGLIASMTKLSDEAKAEAVRLQTEREEVARQAGLPVLPNTILRADLAQLRRLSAQF